MPNPRQNAKTPFGRYLVAVRAARHERLCDMARALDMSDAYLSSIEVGRRNVPKGFVDKLITLGYIDAADRVQIDEWIYLSRTTERFSVKDLSLEQQRLVRLFALRLPTMNEDELSRVRTLLEPEVHL